MGALLKGCWLLIIVFLFFCLHSLPGLAVMDRVPLTVTLLQERLSAPVLKEGMTTINLANLVIDIRDENKELQEQFYQQIQGQINRAKQPLGLDFSNSLIQGNFIASRLGLPTPLTKVALATLLSPTEEQLLQQDENFLFDSDEPVFNVTVFRGPVKLQGTVFMGEVDFSKTFFLQIVEAMAAKFSRESNWLESRFARVAKFSQATFMGDVNFSQSQFLNKAIFRSAHFKSISNFHRSHFTAEAYFDQTKYDKPADFTRTFWQKEANFSQSQWRDRPLFSKSRFLSLLTFRNATFEKSGAFRSSYFNGVVSFQDVKLLDQVDFSNSTFTKNSYLSVSGLAFDSDKAKILGDRGVIGQAIYLPNLAGNETVLRNLVRNFRSLEQIADANQIEYKTEKLRLQQLRKKLKNISIIRLINLTWVADFLHTSFLTLLLLLSQDGTNFSLVFGTGIIIFAYFGCLFWLIDRVRRLTPKPVIPNGYEIFCMVTSYIILTLSGVFNILQSASRPLLTLTAIALILVPLPLILIIELYRRGRYHDLMDSSYFLQDGSMRQLRLLITRLPVVPEFPLFRDRYTPIPWQKRWNWLNYYDLSLNNLLKLGFNDWRVRDQELPTIVSFLVWYQWGIGIFYITLLIWTLSRTIPGLNLLIYLK
ncbi:MAG: pentapeptide repeat-containing protein [Microcystis aeruginosa Ma_MB_S_20031200_S102]|uniref:Pentapeptide repeat-containing protein n=1 Tax=Microcystis aeruginosa Ma_MB_S_20031200_S102 TaxID=2486254 RepID=A0A552F818_MICAE|nr:MAG: pentapeptide repeat-containing protein [Microcystis aeruginosa Ma_MB_S_20031200_S102D]TRU42866.1 MAG: pentapeptide repeat-containing protein [Microcystis aeruginosa Ma_MB_S_20031200_S102]